jgi:hypothetical protein
MKKSSRVFKPRKIAITLTAMLGVFLSSTVAARAGLLDQLKNISVVKDAIGSFNQVTNVFAKNIKDFTNIADVDGIRGVLGQFTPDKAKKEIDNKVDPNNQIATILKQGATALFTSQLAADQVLSEPGQAAGKATLDKVADLDTSSASMADEVYSQSEQSQNFSSSQDVLKNISKQLSGQADINAAQVRLSALQNNNSQELKTQLAAMNLSNASREEREMGERQSKVIEDLQGLAAHNKAIMRHYSQGQY